MHILTRRRVNAGIIHPSEDVSIISPAANPVAIQDVSIVRFLCLRIHQLTDKSVVIVRLGQKTAILFAPSLGLSERFVLLERLEAIK